jgi:hypothetical protein
MHMADPESQIAGQEPGSLEIVSEIEDWPPASFAENDHILVWWLPEYDDVLRQLVEEYQWAWRSVVLSRLESLIPEKVLRAWRDTDPLCHEYSWYNVLAFFAAARAKQLSVYPRQPQRIACSCCSREFLESHLPQHLVVRVGANGIDVCEKCLGRALDAKGSPTSTPEAVTAVLQTLSRGLQRPPKGSDLNGRLDLKGLSRDARAAVIQALRVKPTVARVKELFGSWEAAVAHAAAAPMAPLPPSEPAAPAPPSKTAFTSHDPARYRSATGPLPEVTLDTGREPSTYREEVHSLIGTGYLALAEAALIKLTERDPLFNYLLAEVYGQTARFDEACAAYKQPLRDGQEDFPVDHLLQPRDLRTISAGPAFYEPLSTLPRGNVRFVLVGGSMEYVDLWGEHRCTTGEPPDGGVAAELAESVARMSAMVDSAPWMQAATGAGQAILKSLARSGGGVRPYGHMVSWVTSSFRDIVKALTGAPPKVAEDPWCLSPVGKSGWSYQRNAGHYVFNAHAGFTFMTVEAAPAVCIWGWPDRSDLCLQAFADTVAAGTPEPVTVILPDVPAFRHFARRYVRGEHMEKSARALLEECLYRLPGGLPNMRGDVLAAEFAPRLIVHADGTEDDGTVLAGALAYLDAHHTLRLSVWDVLNDSLLREAASAAPVAARPFYVAAPDRADTVRWYARYAGYYDSDELLHPSRPSLLDAVNSA